jgi:hypothetical protein
VKKRNQKGKNKNFSKTQHIVDNWVVVVADELTVGTLGGF